MTALRAPVPAALAAAALAAVTAGCGSSAPSSNGEDKKTPTQVVADAKQALSTTKSVRVAGQLNASGQPGAVDIRFLRGTGAVGTLTLLGSTLSIVRTGDTTYVKVSGGQLAAIIPGGSTGKFVKLPNTGQAAQQFASFSDLDTFAKDLLSPTKLAPTLRTATVRGQKAVVLTDQGDNNSTLYVAATGTPLPLEVQAHSGEDTGTIDFTEYGAPLTITAPAGAIDAPAAAPTP